MSPVSRFKLIFFVPNSAVEQCKRAVFAAGAGCYPGPGNYTECCFTMRGIGQFRPGDSANPNIGSVGKLEEVEEIRLETLCQNKGIADEAIRALNNAHPYEEPAYEVYKMEDV